MVSIAACSNIHPCFARGLVFALVIAQQRVICGELHAMRYDVVVWAGNTHSTQGGEKGQGCCSLDMVRVQRG
jgi:hypothetical protein